MKIELQHLLNEFIERDFTIYEMHKVLDALLDLHEELRLRELYRKRQDFNMIKYTDRDIKIAKKEAKKILDEYSLEYELDELIKY